MHGYSKIDEYIKVMCEQIRWKKAHQFVSTEIENHIVDQKNAFLSEGYDEETAMDKALEEMGDPVLVGTQLDNTHKPNTEWSIIGITALALFIGLGAKASVISTTGAASLWTNVLASTLIGIGFMVLAYFVDFTILGKYSKAIFLGLIATTLAVMLVSPTVYGRHLYVPFLLLLFPTAFAGIIYEMRTKGYMGIVICGVLLVAPMAIALSTPSISSALLIAATGLSLLTLAAVKGWFRVNKIAAVLLMYTPAVGAIIAYGWLTIVGNSYRWQRYKSAIDPSIDPMGAGYLASTTRSVIDSAKIFGQGNFPYMLESMLPELHTDSLLTYLIHNFGWISFIVITAVLMALIVRSLILCSRQKSVLGRLVSTAVTLTLMIQIVVYLAYNMGYPVIAPLTLPLISTGGTATVINLLLVGIMLSVFKSGNVVSDKMMPALWNETKLVEFNNGKIIINITRR